MIYAKVDLPEMTNGSWRVEQFTVDPERDVISMLRLAMRGRSIRPGTYTRLMRDSTLVMSDTPAEMKDHHKAIQKAKDHCLINGLGIGMVLKNILLKKDVTKVTVIELSQDLIDIVKPHYTDPRVEIICCSAFDYKPPKDIYYGMIWHDIWDHISADNIPEMKRLHRKYYGKTEWQGSWCREECVRHKLEYDRSFPKPNKRLMNFNKMLEG